MYNVHLTHSLLCFEFVELTLILQGSDTLIYQPFIPAIGGRRTFPTETQAKNTGQLVVQKLSEGKSPTLTREEVQNCLNKNSH